MLATSECANLPTRKFVCMLSSKIVVFQINFPLFLSVAFGNQMCVFYGCNLYVNIR